MGKKGGAKNKMAKMSEEERARYLQHRADIEEEARRRKQQLIALYMKNKLKREEAFSRLNLAKINQEWRTILRQIKCDELKNEIVEVEKFFKEALEQKSRIIHRLLKDLDIAEEMYSTLVQAHLQNIDRLIATQGQRMEFFKDQYNEEKNAILRQCQVDFGQFKDARDNSQKQLECVYYCFEEESDNNMHQLDEEHLHKLDELRSLTTVKLEEITKSREVVLERLWKEYQQVLNDYFRHTETFYADYMELKENDNDGTTVTRNLSYELERATDQLTDLKITSETITEEGELKINYLKKYKTDMNSRYLKLKLNLENMLSFDSEKLKFMVCCAHATIKNLESNLKKGESILQLVTVCRKLETEKEKVVPFGFENDLISSNLIDEHKSPTKDVKNVPLNSLLNMEKFWKRVNNVRLDVACLKEKKKQLEKENAKLKFELKQCLSNLAISTGSAGTYPNRTLSRPASLQVDKVVPINLSRNINQSKSATAAANWKIKRRQFTCIEANLTNAARSAKLTKGFPTTAKIRAIIN